MENKLKLSPIYLEMKEELKDKIASDPSTKDLIIDTDEKMYQVWFYLQAKENNYHKGYIPKLNTTGSYWNVTYISTEEQARKEKRIKAFKIAGEDSRDYGASLEKFNIGTYKRRNAKNIALNIVELMKQNQKVKGIYIYSEQFQIGKTYLANAITNELADAGITGIFVFAPSLVSQSREFKQLEHMMRELKECQVLVIDDIGAEYKSEWFRIEVLLPVLQNRLSSSKVTIFTSNYDIQGLERKYKLTSDDMDVNRLLSRIMELAMPVELDDVYGNG